MVYVNPKNLTNWIYLLSPISIPSRPPPLSFGLPVSSYLEIEGFHMCVVTLSMHVFMYIHMYVPAYRMGSRNIITHVDLCFIMRNLQL